MPEGTASVWFGAALGAQSPRGGWPHGTPLLRAWQPIEPGQLQDVLASGGDRNDEDRHYVLISAFLTRCAGSRCPLGRIASGGCWRGDPAVRQEQESRKSPDSVRFLGYL
jgi:hypothetical protein